MADAVAEELVDLMSVSGSITGSGVEIAMRFADIADRVQINVAAADDDALALLEAIQGGLGQPVASPVSKEE